MTARGRSCLAGRSVAWCSTRRIDRPRSARLATSSVWPCLTRAAAPGAGMLLLATRRNGRAEGGGAVTSGGAWLEGVSPTITTTAVTATASAITETHRLTGPNFWTGLTTLCNPTPSANPPLRAPVWGYLAPEGSPCQKAAMVVVACGREVRNHPSGRHGDPAARAGGDGRAGRLGRGVRVGGRVRRRCLDAACGDRRAHRAGVAGDDADAVAVAPALEGRKPGRDARPALGRTGGAGGRPGGGCRPPPRHGGARGPARTGGHDGRGHRSDPRPLGRPSALPRDALHLLVRPGRPDPCRPPGAGADPDLGGRGVAAAAVDAAGAALRRHHPPVLGRGRP